MLCLDQIELMIAVCVHVGVSFTRWSNRKPSIAWWKRRLVLKLSQLLCVFRQIVTWYSQRRTFFTSLAKHLSATPAEGFCCLSQYFKEG